MEIVCHWAWTLSSKLLAQGHTVETLARCGTHPAATRTSRMNYKACFAILHSHFQGSDPWSYDCAGIVIFWCIWNSHTCLVKYVTHIHLTKQQNLRLFCRTMSSHQGHQVTIVTTPHQRTPLGYTFRDRTTTIIGSYVPNRRYASTTLWYMDVCNMWTYVISSPLPVPNQDISHRYLSSSKFENDNIPCRYLFECAHNIYFFMVESWVPFHRCARHNPIHVPMLWAHLSFIHGKYQVVVHI
jgi:hypothetical protein